MKEKIACKGILTPAGTINKYTSIMRFNKIEFYE